MDGAQVPELAKLLVGGCDGGDEHEWILSQPCRVFCGQSASRLCCMKLFVVPNTGHNAGDS